MNGVTDNTTQTSLITHQCASVRAVDDIVGGVFIDGITCLSSLDLIMEPILRHLDVVVQVCNCVPLHDSTSLLAMHNATRHMATMVSECISKWCDLRCGWNGNVLRQ